MGTNGQLTKLSAELEDFRVYKDLTYKELADEIEKVTKRRRDHDCWRRVCLGLTTRPQQTTVGIIRSFLDTVHRRAKATKQRRARRAA